MAERALTAPEIDALLTIFRGGESSMRQDAEVENFDVSQPSRVPRGAFGALKIRHQQASRNMAQDLKSVLGSNIRITLEDFEQRVFEPWRRTLPDPCCAFLVELAPLKEAAVLVLDHAMAFSAVDRLLGGSGESQQEPRDLTPTECAVLGEFLAPIVQGHIQAWQPYVSLSGRVQKAVFVPAFIREVAEKEVVLAAKYRIEGFGEPASLRFAVAASGLEPHLQHEPRPDLGAEDRNTSREQVARSLSEVEVGMSVRLGGAELMLHDILGLEPGDVVVLDRRADRPLELLVEGSPRLDGYLKRRGRRLVFEAQSGPVDSTAAPEAGAGDEGVGT